MIKFSKETDYVDVDKYTERLSVAGYVTVDEDKMQRTLRFNKYREDSVCGLCIRTMQADSGLQSGMLNRQSIIHFLQTHMGVPYKYLKRKDGESIDEKALSKIRSLKYAPEFIDNYLEYTSLKSRNSRASKTLERLEATDMVDRFDRPIKKLYFEVSQQDNLRFYYRNSDLIGIGREYNNCYVAPKGYVLVWGDLKQSDFRFAFNLLIRDERNAHLMDSTTDSYEGMYKILADYFGEPYNREEFLEVRDIVKLNSLETIYGKSEGNTPKENEYIQRFKKYLDTCPRYQEFINRIKSKIELNLPLYVKSYFGFLQTIAKPTPVQAEKKALNAPFQTGTSELIMLITNAILDKFYDHGYTEEDIRIFVARHDEMVFLVREELLKDAWIFQECGSVYIDNFSAMGMDFKCGYNYKEVDEDLTTRFQASVAENFHLITDIKPDPGMPNFMPVKKFLNIGAYYRLISDQLMVVAIVSEDNRCKIKAVNLHGEVDDKLLIRYMVKLVEDNSKDLLEKDYDSMVIQIPAEQESTIQWISGLYLAFRPSTSPLVNKAAILVEYGTKLYADKTGVDVGTIDEEMIQLNQSMINSMGDLDVFKD